MFEVEPIGHVRGGRDDAGRRLLERDSLQRRTRRGSPVDSLDGIDEFSHVEIVFLFDRVEPGKIVSGSRHPRNNPEWPLVGIFAQRGKNRPNRLGCTIVPLIAREGRSIVVGELDAIDGTPVLDIKPVFADYLLKTPVVQPEWSLEIMREYWSTPDKRSRDTAAPGLQSC